MTACCGHHVGLALPVGGRAYLPPPLPEAGHPQGCRSAGEHGAIGCAGRQNLRQRQQQAQYVPWACRARAVRVRVCVPPIAHCSIGGHQAGLGWAASGPCWRACVLPCNITSAALHSCRHLTHRSTPAPAHPAVGHAHSCTPTSMGSNRFRCGAYVRGQQQRAVASNR